MHSAACIIHLQLCHCISSHLSQILDTTHQHFDKLSIQQFFTLYKAFRIWPNKVHDYYIKIAVRAIMVV